MEKCSRHQFNCECEEVLKKGLTSYNGSLPATCIPVQWLCDGSKDCRDGSDEIDCFCSEDEFQCSRCERRGGCSEEILFALPQCISSQHLQDGNYDCVSHRDEKYNYAIKCC